VKYLLASLLMCAGLMYLFAPSRGIARRRRLSDLATLEEEVRASKVNPEELEALRRAYELETIAALEELDALQSSRASDEALEKEVAEIRERLACPSCGAVRDPDRARCARCGA
jgi:hypothetical protein